ncbi:Uncharacterised protein [Bordetella pertussis]|nr:Uncharacterised protein [Bordetella pertussis]CPI99822.1 Uncharacterised protein [Bordetella pertussis]CPJ21130.1 Uncharacterised protein [Bordetella pertussis]CPN51607.1 Uncharacterised protein [Bordetella pertussis]
MPNSAATLSIMRSMTKAACGYPAPRTVATGTLLV